MSFVNLALSGGGMQGFSFLGAIKKLEEEKILDKVTSFSGSSVGSLFAILLAIGYTPDELFTLLYTLDMASLVCVDISMLWTQYGMDTGEAFMEKVMQWIKEKTGSTETTFGDIQKKYKKTLWITGSCISHCELHWFNTKEHPDMPVWKAIRISVSVPGFFTPFSYENHLLIDGAILCHVPVPQEWDAKKTLAVELVSSPDDENVELHHWEDYLSRIFFTVRQHIRSIQPIQYCSIVSIPINDVFFADFTVSMEKRRNMIDLGYNVMQDYFLRNRPI